jgi:hypothetical protein
MLGRKLLLVLDDLWDPEVEQMLNAVDAASGSKVLISSRVRGALAGSDVVEVGAPSEAEAVRRLLATAGLPDDAAAPSEARAVVRFCNCLVPPSSASKASKFLVTVLPQPLFTNLLLMELLLLLFSR